MSTADVDAHQGEDRRSSSSSVARQPFDEWSVTDSPKARGAAVHRRGCDIPFTVHRIGRPITGSPTSSPPRDDSRVSCAAQPHPSASSSRPASRSAASSPACGRSPTWSATARTLDLDAAAADLARYAEAGFDTFDMADHYGSAEDIAGRFNALVAGRQGAAAADAARAVHQVVPDAGPMTPEIVRAAVERSADAAADATHRPAAVPLVDVRASRPTSTRCASWRRCATRA